MKTKPKQFKKCRRVLHCSLNKMLMNPSVCVFHACDLDVEHLAHKRLSEHREEWGVHMDMLLISWEYEEMQEEEREGEGNYTLQYLSWFYNFISWQRSVCSGTYHLSHTDFNSSEEMSQQAAGYLLFTLCQKFSHWCLKKCLRISNLLHMFMFR